MIPHENEIFPVSPEMARASHCDDAAYQEMYARSIDDPDGFWAEQAESLEWMQRWTKVKDSRFGTDAQIRWFEGGKINVSVNCIDRHLETRGDQTAILWEGDDPEISKSITYRELHREVCRMANVLKAQGVKKGDRVTIYMPMIPEVAYAMLACTRIGAIHSVVFGGFSPDSLANRIHDCDSNCVITADEGVRGGRSVPLKANTDHALTRSPSVKSVIVVRRTGGAIEWTDGRDVWYHEEAAKVADDCPAEEMDAADPLFVLYTSGSTGKPKGVMHTTGGYLLYASLTHKYVFDYHGGDIYWCTADVGWVTGHSYIVYGPLANGATTLMFEGVPNYPDSSRFWQVVDKHQVNIFYTAPTAIRALMREGEGPVTKSSRASLRILGTGGEPINVDDTRMVLPPKSEVHSNIEALMNHFKLIMEGPRPPAGEVYHAVEGANGELGFYLVSDGSGRRKRRREEAFSRRDPNPFSSSDDDGGGGSALYAHTPPSLVFE